MISFNDLGNYGRLGNQMFQYAALRGIADYHGYDFCIPPSTAMREYEEHLLLEGFELPGLNRDNVRIHNTSSRFNERQYHYDKEFFENCPDGIDIKGYFQTEKYFYHMTPEIRRDFTFKKEIFDAARACMNDIIKMTGFDVISVHVRRGDYVNQQDSHPVCSLEYYEAALEKMPMIMGIVFTDDQEWAMQQKLFHNGRFFFATPNNSNLYDMCLMSLCNHHIIANSSFSWWGAWLANSKKVIAPKKWYGSSINHDTSDLIPLRWERI